MYGAPHNWRAQVRIHNSPPGDEPLGKRPYRARRNGQVASAFNEYTCTVHQMNPKAGGAYRMSFQTVTTGQTHSFDGQYEQLVPSERLHYTDNFADPNLPGKTQVTVTLKKSHA